MTEDMSSRADFILEFMRLGMDFGNACIATECTPEMIKQLEEDPEFQQRKKFVLAKLEGELLKRLNKASEFAALKGDTRCTERLLELINPKRYGKKATIALPSDGKDTPKEMRISFVSGNANDEEEEPDIVSAEA
jgi:hypothetical protein